MTVGALWVLFRWLYTEKLRRQKERSALDADLTCQSENLSEDKSIVIFNSFTMLSATGLDDILPIGSGAWVLVILEQFVGVAYIAVVVSRLIGMTIVRRKRDSVS